MKGESGGIGISRQECYGCDVTSCTQRVQRPGETIMFYESRYGELDMNVSQAQTEFIQIFQPAPYYSGSAGRHMQIELVNALFVDGHAKAVGKQEYVDGLAYNP